MENNQTGYDFTQHDREANQFFENMFSPIRNLYVDVNCIRDHKLACVLSLIKTEVQYKYLLHKVPVYNEDLDRDIENSFPALKIKNDTISNMLADSNNHPTIAKCAPATNVYTELKSILDKARFRNAHVHNKPNLVTLYVNTNGVTYPKEIKDSFSVDFKEFYPELEVSYLNRPFKDLDGDFLKTLDIVIVDDLMSGVLDEECSFHSAFFYKHYFQDKFFMATRQTDGNTEFTSKEELEEATKNTSTLFEVFSDFSFIQRYIPITKKDNINE